MKNKIHYAGFWRRLSAGLIDILITTPILYSIFYLFGLDKYITVELDENLYSFIENQKTSLNRNIIDIISIIITASYSVFFLTSNKMATPGKMIFGIKVIDVNGQKITIKKAIARFFASILSTIIFGIGLIMIAFCKEKTALHDLICKTRVVRKS